MKTTKVKKKAKHMTSIGGQALIEGVMMRGPKDVGIAVRKPDGKIEIKKEKVENITTRSKAFKLPFIRGVVALVESLVIGTKALMFSAEFIEDADVDQQPGKIELFLERKLGDRIKDIGVYATVFISLMFSVLLFMVIPTGMTSLFKSFTSNGVVLNMIEGLIRVTIFLAYLISISRLKDIQRTFEYHGAEHKTIHCYENEEDLTVENIRKYPVLHPRCGTSFLFMVMIISIIVFSFFGWPSPAMRIVSRILLFPVVGGISYEINKLIGRSDSKLAYALSYPGLVLQNIATTREPDDKQIEVAVEALKLVLVEDKEADKW